MSLDWSTVKALSIPVGGVSRDVKRVSVGGVEVWRKLPYDAEVEYIESTGTQWIDTGIPLAGALDAEAGIRFTFDAAGTKMALASAGPNNNRGFVFCMADSSGAKWNLGIGANAYGTAIVSGTWYDARAVIRAAGSSLYVNDSLSASAGAATLNGLNLYAFARNNNGTADLLTNSRNTALSYLKIYVSDALVRDLIPVRVGSGANAVGCLYDKLGTGGQNPDGSARNDGLYFRQGSGAFVVGPDKTS